MWTVSGSTIFSRIVTRELKGIRNIAAHIRFVINEGTLIHDCRRHVEVMNAPANKARLISVESAPIEYRPRSAVLGRLIIDPNATTVAVCSIAGESYIVEFSV